MNSFSTYLYIIRDYAWIVEMILLSMTWAIFSVKKFTLKSVAHYTLGLGIILFLSNMGLFLLVAGSKYSFPVLWSVIHGIVSFVFVQLLAPFQKKSKLLLWIAIYNVVLSTSSLSGQCSLITSTLTDNSITIGTIRAAIYLMMPLAAYFLRKKKFDDYLVIPNSCLLLVGILLICEFALAIAEAMLDMGSSPMNFYLIYALAFACMLATDLVSVQALDTICSEQQEVYNLTAENQRFLAEREINEIAATSLEDLRCIRHDLKNQYGYLKILSDQGRYEELKDYLKGLEENLPTPLHFIDCGNKVVNNVLNMEFSKLRTRGIALEHKLVVPPLLPCRDEDVCSLLANLLDNAREECCRLQALGIPDTKVKLEIHPHSSYLLIRCLNSTDRTELHRRRVGLTTTKSDREYHGFGTRIIVKLAEKYNGCADFSLEDGMFVAQVMIDMTERNDI